MKGAWEVQSIINNLNVFYCHPYRPIQQVLQHMCNLKCEQSYRRECDYSLLTVIQVLYLAEMELLRESKGGENIATGSAAEYMVYNYQREKSTNFAFIKSSAGS